jgi:hypothetical protein
MDRICEIVVIPDVVASVDALAASWAHAAVVGAEWPAAQRIGATMAEEPWQHPADPFWRHSEGPGRTWTVWSSEIFQTGEPIRLAVVEVVVPLHHEAIHRTGRRIGTCRIPRRSRMYPRFREP